jgi:hypothetical protein
MQMPDSSAAVIPLRLLLARIDWFSSTIRNLGVRLDRRRTRSRRRRPPILSDLLKPHEGCPLLSSASFELHIAMSTPPKQRQAASLQNEHRRCGLQAYTEDNTSDTWPDDMAIDAASDWGSPHCSCGDGGRDDPITPSSPRAADGHASPAW